MDYPAPYVTLKSGALDLSDAYAQGLGAYDRWVIAWGYGADASRADAVAEDGIAQGLRFVADDDARPARAAHPLGSLWDNGPDAVEELKRILQVRRVALDRFGLRNVPLGQPISTLEPRLVPIYLLHRYQVAAAAKSLGGADFSYSVRTASGPSPATPIAIVPAERQRAALAALLETLDPDVLALPSALLALLPPTAFGYSDGSAEHFPGHESPLFDRFAAAAVAADLTISALVQPERAARLVDFHGRDAANPDFLEVVSALVAKTFGSSTRGELTLRRTVQNVVVTRLMGLASNTDAAFAVRAVARQGLKTARASLGVASDPAGVALREDIDHYLARPETPAPRTQPPAPPPGEPIG
jgi:hypothetical protein